MLKTAKLNKGSFLQALIQRYSSNLFAQLTGFLIGMVVSKILGPEMLGYWGIFHIVTNYYSYSNLGATNGLTRSLGIALGQKDKIKIHTTIGAAHVIQFTLPVLVTFILVIVGLYLDAPLSWIVIFAGIIGFIGLYGETLKRILNSFEKHKTLSRIEILSSVLSLVLVIPLVYFFNIQGRIIAALIVGTIVLIVKIKASPVALGFSFDKNIIKEHILIGFPIALAGFLASNFFLVDRLVITKYLTMEQLGFYVFGFYLVTVVKQIKQTVGNILYQRQNIIFGEDGVKKKRRLYITSTSSALFITDLTGVMAGLLLIIFAFAVKYLLPEYEMAIPLTFVVVFSQVMGSINVFNTVGKHNLYLLLLSLALIFNIGLSILFVHQWGLIGVAYATFISFLLLNIVINYSNLRYFSVSSKQIIFMILRIISVPLYCYLVSAVIKYYLFENYSGTVLRDLLLMLVLLLGYAILMTPLLFFIKGHLKVLNKIKLLNTL